MKSRALRLSTLMALLVLPALPCPAAEESTTELPWVLRETYSYPRGALTFYYAVDNGEMALEFGEKGMVVERVFSALTLGDGAVVDLSQLPEPVQNRELVETPYGEAMRISLTWNLDNGLEVVHAVDNVKQAWQMFIRLQVTNKGAAPVAVAELAPMVFGPTSVGRLSADTKTTAVRLNALGHGLQVAPSGKPLMLKVDDPALEGETVLATLPSGGGTTSADLTLTAGDIKGRIATTFAPPVTLQPGQKLEAAPAWLMCCLTGNVSAREFFGWNWYEEHKAVPVVDPPSAWVTVEDGGSLAELQGDAGAWAREGVNHVLVPSTWQQRPGALSGAGMAFARDMASVAASLRQAGLVPGLTIQPLAINRGGEGWSVEAEGDVWVNPATAEGKAKMLEDLRTIDQWGFAFYVLPSTRMPDAALAHFHLTRDQADTFAMEIATEAMGKKAVYPASSGIISNDPALWQCAAESTTGIGAAPVRLGPVRFDTRGLEALDPAVTAAIGKVEAPVELLGAPGGDLRKAIAAALAAE